MTTVLLVRVTSLKSKLALTSASQPKVSDWAESIPLIRSVVTELSAPTEASQVSSLNVMIRVSPPVTVSTSVADGTTVPDKTAAGEGMPTLLIVVLMMASRLLLTPQLAMGCSVPVAVIALWALAAVCPLPPTCSSVPSVYPLAAVWDWISPLTVM